MWPNLKSAFHVDFLRSTDTWFDVFERDKHGGAFIYHPGEMLIAKNRFGQNGHFTECHLSLNHWRWRIFAEKIVPGASQSMPNACACFPLDVSHTFRSITDFSSTESSPNPPIFPQIFSLTFFYLVTWDDLDMKWALQKLRMVLIVVSATIHIDLMIFSIREN